MKTSLFLAVTLATGLTSSISFAAGSKVDAATQSGTVQLAAVMTEMALACGHAVPKEVEASHSQQRDAAATNLGIKPADYDKLYAGFADDFKKKWATASPAKQKESCDQMKAMATQKK